MHKRTLMQKIGIAGDNDISTSNKNNTAPEVPACSLPLLQIWPSQDSPRGEADGHSFIFPPCEGSSPNQCYDIGIQHDSGIDSVQASPSPGAIAQCIINPPTTNTLTSPTSSNTRKHSLSSPTASNIRRSSNTLLHPDHARLLRIQQQLQPTSPDYNTSTEDLSDFHTSLGLSTSSSTTSSLTSVAATSVAVIGGSTRSTNDYDHRKSSIMTTRYSLFDALDLEYALLRAAARGSVGSYSLGESLHKLSFTQSLAFPALARSFAGKRRVSAQSQINRPLNPNESGLNTFAKIVTALVLVLVSVLVFGVVYKFVRT